MEKTSRFSVYDLPPQEYMGCVATINNRYLDEYALALSGVSMRRSQAVIVVGSDGKRERHAQSRTEFVLLGTPAEPYFDLLAIAIAFSPYHVDHHSTDGSGLESRVVGHEILSHVENDPNTIYPDRILNSTLVAGSKATYSAARTQVFGEMTGDDSTGKRIRDRLGDQLNAHKHAIKDGHWRGNTVFDSAAAVQHYSETGTVAYGFKHAYLRAVQTGFNLLALRTVRKGRIDSGQIVTLMPSCTYDKFDFFDSLGLIDHRLANAAQTAYAWFLREYHRIQERYKDTQRPVALNYNKDEFQTHNQVVTKFLESLSK